MMFIGVEVYNNIDANYKTANIGVVDKNNKIDIDAECWIDFLEGGNYTIYDKFKVKAGEIKRVKLYENKSYHFYCWSEEFYLTKVTDFFAGTVDNTNILIELVKIGDVKFYFEKFKLDNDYFLNITAYSDGNYRKLALCIDNVIPFENQDLTYINSPDRLKDLNCYYSKTSLLNSSISYKFAYNNNFTICAIDSERVYIDEIKQWRFVYEDLDNKNIGGKDYCYNFREK